MKTILTCIIAAVAFCLAGVAMVLLFMENFNITGDGLLLTLAPKAVAAGLFYGLYRVFVWLGQRGFFTDLYNILMIEGGDDDRA